MENEKIEIDRREYVRIDDYLCFDYQVLTPELYEEEKKKFFQKQSGVEQIRFKYPFIPLFWDEYREEETKISTADQLILNLLMDINEKLDTMIKILSEGEASKTNLSFKQACYINISGSGLRFITKEKISPGTFLKIHILIPLFPSFVITTLAQAVRSDEREDKKYEIGARFVAIHEDDRDALIHYIFIRQRKLLRQRQ